MEKESKNLVEVIDLTIGYGSNVIQQNLNFSVAEREVFAILGGSGCGKSTLLKHLIGLYQPFSGDVKIFNESIVHASEDRRREIMQKFGVTYQGGALFGSLTLAENIALPLEEYTSLNKKEIKEVVQEKLSLVDLDGYDDYLPSEISGGMNKRAGLARALALDAKLLFFDEPSAGLDPISSAGLDRLILSLRDKIDATIIIVTHELDSIFSVADRVVMLDKVTKSVVASGKPEELRSASPNSWVRDFLNRTGMKRPESNPQEAGK
jgi:phospholipid/cholesterol/gamma-HCH transport system ATP-binding protein